MAEKPLDESKVIQAKDIVANPDDIRYIVQPCIMISDYSMSMTFNNFIAAVNILVDDGWRLDPAMTNAGYMMALCYNPRYKKKNSASDIQED
jgi:hypothetical protein